MSGEPRNQDLCDKQALAYCLIFKLGRQGFRALGAFGFGVEVVVVGGVKDFGVLGHGGCCFRGLRGLRFEIKNSQLLNACLKSRAKHRVLLGILWQSYLAVPERLKMK